MDRDAFLEAVVGVAGAEALRKAADSSSAIENAIVPRAIIAWLAVVGRVGSYEGVFPGNPDSRLEFKKNERGTFNGSVTISDKVFPFENASVLHLAATMAVALDSDISPDPGMRDIDLARLGRSVDVLAKAQFVLENEVKKSLSPEALKADCEQCGGTGKKNDKPCTGCVASPDVEKAEGPGPAHTPDEQKGPEQAVPQAKAPKQLKRKIPMTPRANNVPAPKAKVQIPKIPGVPKAFPLPTAALKHECSECGMKLFKGEKFTGCLCFYDLAGKVNLTKSEEGYSITFRGVGAEEIGVVLKTLGVH